MWCLKETMLYLLVTMEPTRGNLHGDYSPYVANWGAQRQRVESIQRKRQSLRRMCLVIQSMLDHLEMAQEKTDPPVQVHSASSTHL